MAAAETSEDPACDTQSGYSWYLCTWTTPNYSGCCRVDPCRQEPIGFCPASATDEPWFGESTLTITSYVPSSTLTITRTAQHPSSAVTSSATLRSTLLPSSSTPLSTSPPPLPAPPGAGAPTPPTIPSTSTAHTDDTNGNGLTISVSALIGIVLGCGIVAIFAVLSFCMWWGRRRRQRSEKQGQADKAVSLRATDEELVPPGLESVFNPMAQTGPGSVFDRAEGASRARGPRLRRPPKRETPRLTCLA